MNRNIKKVALLFASTLLLVGCNNNHKKSIERSDALKQVGEAYNNLLKADFKYPDVFTIQAIVISNENDKEEEHLVAASLDISNHNLYYAIEDVVAIGYNPCEEEEVTFDEYTFNYSTDGGETFLEDPLTGEEAQKAYLLYEGYVNSLAKEVINTELSILTLSLANLSALEDTLPDKEEQEEGDLSIDLYELYYQSDDALHLGFKYEYGNLLAEKDDEGEIVEDEEGNPILYIDSEGENYHSDALAIHFEKQDDVLYPKTFVSPDANINFTVNSFLYEGEIVPEE